MPISNNDGSDTGAEAHLPRETARSVSREWTIADCSRAREIRPRHGTGPRRRTGPRPQVSSGHSTASDCERIKTPTERPREVGPACKRRRSYKRCNREYLRDGSLFSVPTRRLKAKLAFLLSRLFL